MFYFLSKLVAYFLTPAGWLLLTLLWAYVGGSPQKQRQRIGAALLLFWVFGNHFFVNELALAWERPSVPVTRDSTRNVVVVLTGGIVQTNRNVEPLRPLLGTQADRMGQALYLYKTGVVQKILISGATTSLFFMPESRQDEGKQTAAFLRLAGVRPGDIVLEQNSRNTHENAVFSAQLLKQRFNTNRCVLVTSAFHMRRAEACFRKAGVDVTPFPGAFLSQERSWAPGEWLLPKEQVLQDAYALMKEWFGYVSYAVVGYI